METQVVVLELANEHYGVDIAAIEGIIKMRAITRMPHAPSYIEGITNLRGTVVPVIDLRRRFGLERQPVTEDTRIVVAYMEENKVGMIVDAVSQVIRVADAPSSHRLRWRPRSIRHLSKGSQRLTGSWSSCSTSTRFSMRPRRNPSRHRLRRSGDDAPAYEEFFLCCVRLRRTQHQKIQFHFNYPELTF